MYPSTSLFIAVGQLAIVTLVMFSYPLQVHPCRNCLEKVFHPEHVVAKSMAEEVEEEEELEPGGDEHGHHGELSPVKRFLFTTGIVIGGFSLAYFVNDLQMGTLERAVIVSDQPNSLFSPLLCGRNWIDNNLLHPPRITLLEGISPIFPL
jgi:hypothetical protein